MKVRIKNEELKKALKVVEKTLPKKAGVEILKHILAEVEGDTLTLTSTNLDEAIRYKIPCKVLNEEGPSSTVIPKDFIKLAKNFEDTIDLEFLDNKIIITTGNKQATLPAFRPEEYANIPTVDGTVIMVDFKTFKNLLDKTSYAISTKEASRYVFKGVCVDIINKEMIAVGTDSTRLALCKTPADYEDMRFIVRGTTTNILRKLKGEDIIITIGKEVIKFDFGTFELYALLITGEYPAYPSVIPNEEELTKIIVDTKEIRNALEYLQVTKEDKIRLNFKADSIIIEKQDGDQIMKIEIACKGIETDPYYFYGFKLLEGIEAIEDKETMIGIYKPTHPVLVKGTEDKNYLYVIMPQKGWEV